LYLQDGWVLVACVGGDECMQPKEYGKQFSDSSYKGDGKTVTEEQSSTVREILVRMILLIHPSIIDSSLPSQTL